MPLSFAVLLDGGFLRRIMAATILDRLRVVQMSVYVLRAFARCMIPS